MSLDVFGVEMEYHVPGERLDHRERTLEHAQIRRAAQVPHEIEAHTAHAARVQRLEPALGRVVPDHRHAAPGAAWCELPGPSDRFEHRAIVRAVAACLDQYGARKTQILVQRA